MNRIYSLKFCHLTQGLIAVSEISRKVVKRTGRKLLRISLISTTIASMATPMISHASILRSDVSYQTFRDFAENKGLFVPGAIDIPIYDKDGNLVGRLDKAPMPNFSSVSTSGVATLISPQYLASVKHNSGYKTVSFGSGGNSYSIVDRNNHSSVDFHAPRLNKLVTEVIPTAVTEEGITEGAYKNTERYTAFYRVGSGTQYIKDKDGNRSNIAGGYAFRTGGTVGTPRGGNSSGKIHSNPGQLYNSENGPLSSYGTPGDSGSPLFAFDALQQKWVLVAVTTAYSGLTGVANYWQVIPLDFLNEVIQEDFDAPVTSVSGQGVLNWNYDQAAGIGTLTQGTTTWDMHGQKENDLNAGKNLVFNGKNGEIVLKDSVTQGAGYLEFADSYTVSAASDQTWTGAGIITDKGTNVSWKVNGVDGDNLHKLGEGTLTINGTGVNPGGLKVGDGTVVLAQKADASGQVQAFSSINLASGRPTVILADAQQVNPDNISWGYRGGVLDMNSNSLTFHQLKAADYGAVLANNATGRATVTLDYTMRAEEVALNSWSSSRKGTVGNLYKYSNPYTKTTDYFILKKGSYGYLPTNQSSNDVWEYIGHSQDDAQKLVADRFNAAGYLFHGQLKGNMNVENRLPQGTTGALVLDGSADIYGSFTQENGQLFMQGHPVIHAISNQSVVNKLNNLGDNSLSTQPVSFTQQDWETRQFTLNQLNLKNTDFNLARNAILNTHILADNSKVTLGSDELYLDMKDGSSGVAEPVLGISKANTEADQSQYQGEITLQNGSTLDINSKFSGGIEAYDSSINVTSPDTLLSGVGVFANSSLNIQDGGHLTAQKGIYSDGRIQLSKDSTLSLSGTPVDSTGTQYSPVLYLTEGYDLKGQNSSLNITQGAHVSGNILASAPAHINIGSDNPIALSLSATAALASSLLSGYNAAFNGAITGGQGDVNMQNALWELNGDSAIRTLTARNSRVNSESDRAFRTLTMDIFDATGSDFALRADLKDADKINITNKAIGADNTLQISFMKHPIVGQSLNIPLVSAPAGTATDIFKAGTRMTGFSQVTPTLRVDSTDSQTQWILAGVRTETDQETVAKATSFMNVDYKHFMKEVNSLNKRMGELRDIQGNAGGWARIISGTGSASGGYSDNYTHVQIGVDKKHELDGANLFTGVTMTYTDNNASSQAFFGSTKSVGGGVYASTLFDSGAYIDVIGKYVHHDNDYTGNFAKLGSRSYTTHSWYTGAEAGYRYHLTEDTFIEPQAELVYGAVSGKSFHWQDGNMDLSMKSKSFTPLIGRTGVELGKTFRGKDWSVTARAGTSWQFDLRSNGETVLQDASGEKRIKGERDSRMLLNVGMNAQIKDNMRLGLQFEKSAFGQYNVDNAVNANFRYTF
ncbi:S6 family peptidase [Yersinia enterocolitica]|uniref:S6 family peptidase n=1 Tax=Yersinia enterocolitica TaxID=630 RepID=UPI003F429688|nr:autotransporter outer membrane beta-barrel domain-containing protein [Yersinia enterocolitica]